MLNLADRRSLMVKRTCPLLRQDGFSFVSILLAMLIAAALYFGYFQFQSTTSERKIGITAIDLSRNVACRTNRQNIERALMMWSVGHEDAAPSLAALEASGFHVPTCPEGGHYDLVGREVHCSLHK